VEKNYCEPAQSLKQRQVCGWRSRSEQDLDRKCFAKSAMQQANPQHGAQPAFRSAPTRTIHGVPSPGKGSSPGRPLKPPRHFCLQNRP